jgi:hypothetical protein
MILGLSYSEAASLYPKMTGAGYGPHVLDDILANRGFAVARKFRFSAEAHKQRDPWPPAPFGKIHWCQVINEFGGHAVLMLEDGSVLDPAYDEPRCLSDYREVNSVAAIVRLA